MINEIHKNNEIILQQYNVLNQRILDEDIAHEVYELFRKNNTQGLARRIGISSKFATKSGTSNENKRINFVAFEKNGLIIVVTVAKDNNESMNAFSNKAGLIVKAIIKELQDENVFQEYHNQNKKSIEKNKKNSQDIDENIFQEDID
jgi:membrane peptidoglycan carboxypeptidase